MANNPEIICFRHCCSQSIFCKCVPKICPICQTCIVNYIVEPFLIPYPYTNAMHEPTTIVIRPSQGNFLHDYDTSSDLHIGIVNSKGVIVEFDQVGLIINDRSKWTNCIAIKVVSSPWDSHWDDILDAMLKDIKWKSQNYDEVAMNCFNFVIEFLNNLKYTDITFINKEDICDKLLLPKIQDAVKYNSLFRKIDTNGYFIST